MDKREYICRRALKMLHSGDVVNLGIGMPTGIIPLLTDDMDICVFSENGIIGLGGDSGGIWDRDAIDAGGVMAPIRHDGACLDIPTSMGLLRGGHIDAAILGAYEVDQEGNLANWTIPGKIASGMGGAMDISVGAAKLIVVTEHCDKSGTSKILKKCRLPLTCAACVDYIVTEMAVFHKTGQGLVLEEIAPGYTIEDIINNTEADVLL